MAAPTKTANTAVKPEKPKYTGRFLTPSDGMKITRAAREWAKAETPYGTG